MLLINLVVSNGDYMAPYISGNIQSAMRFLKPNKLDGFKAADSYYFCLVDARREEPISHLTMQISSEKEKK